MSWEQLTALSEACERRRAEDMLMLMTACQGEDKSWKEQRRILIARLKRT